MSSCQQSNGILSASTILSEHSPTIVWTLDDIQLIGGIRIGLQAPGDFGALRLGRRDPQVLQQLHGEATCYIKPVLRRFQE